MEELNTMEELNMMDELKMMDEPDKMEEPNKIRTMTMMIHIIIIILFVGFCCDVG